MPMLTKSSWSAAAGMEPVAAGWDRMRFSQTRAPAVYWVSIRPENMPAPLVRKAGRPTLRCGFMRRLWRRSDRTAMVVTDVPRSSSGRAMGTPWKLAPVRTSCSSGKKTGLSAAPLSSISIM